MTVDIFGAWEGEWRLIDNKNSRYLWGQSAALKRRDDYIIEYVDKLLFGTILWSHKSSSSSWWLHEMVPRGTIFGKREIRAAAANVQRRRRRSVCVLAELKLV